MFMCKVICKTTYLPHALTLRIKLSSSTRMNCLLLKFVRCKDPKECGTYFSALRCPAGKKCSGGNLLPKNPLKLDGNAKWECDNPKCGHITTFMKTVVPALGSVFQETEMEEDAQLFTDFEIYIGDDLATEADLETAALTQLQFVLQTLEKLGRCENIVHRNHYSLLPLKTACIATSHSLLQHLERFDGGMFDKVMESYVMIAKEVYDVVNVFLPGVTSERGKYLSHNLLI